MKKRIIISESEKKTILGLYNLLKEDVTDDIKVGDTLLREYQALNEKILIIINKIGTDVNYTETNLFYKTGQKEVNEKEHETEWFKDFYKNYKKIDKTEYDKIISDFDANQKSKNNGVEKQTTNDETKKDSDDIEDEINTDENWDTLKITGVVKGMTIKGEITIPNILVSFDGDDKVSEQDETDKNGNFEVNLPNVGEYVVSAAKGDKDYNLKKIRYNFIKDSNIEIILEPKSDLLPKVRIFTKKIFNIAKNIFTFDDPKQKTLISFLTDEETDNKIYNLSKTQHEYCIRFTETYYDYIINAYKNSDERRFDQTKIPEAKQFINECYTSFQKPPYKRLLKAKAKMNKFYKKLQNLPMAFRKYGF